MMLPKWDETLIGDILHTWRCKKLKCHDGFSKKAIKIGKIFQLIWRYFVNKLFVAFLENLNFTCKNRTANPAHPVVLFPGLFWCALKKPIMVFQLLANFHKTFYDISRHCLVMYNHMLLNSCLIFISCV